MNYIEDNGKIWDNRSENNDIWSIPVTSEMIRQAREGVWSIVLTPKKPVPRSWFPVCRRCPASLEGMREGSGKERPFACGFWKSR